MRCHLKISLLLFAFLFGFTAYGQKKGDDFSFVFLTDIHLRPDSVAANAFSKAVRKVREIDPDFVLSGGDQVFDVMRGNQAKGDSLFRFYVEQSKRFGKPVYNTVGNHELFGIYKESPEDSNHPDYKTGMYERYLGATYYTFRHKGWHFFVLNVLDVENQAYIGNVDDRQMSWLKEELSRVPADAPVVLVVHIPLVTAYGDIYPAAGGGSGKPLVRNRDALLEAFKNHRLKLVLQGHLHWFEDLNIEGKTHFITGGAVAGRPSWKGERHGPRGFLRFDIKNGEATYEFIAYEG
ncbi:metallophosphoesterase family protein [Ravibacter arvi]|uniref:metallophosphoesterase family protein n=1 Tax=Ravibacter arvi TaxID=2051041 RepID=UPI0031EE1CE4